MNDKPSQDVVERKRRAPLTEKEQAELRILMSEKEQADKQIGSYLELQVKVHTVIFTAAAVAGGWIFAPHEGTPLPGDVRGTAVLALAFLGSFAALQGVTNYGIVLGYIRHKHLEVGDRMRQLLVLDHSPLTALRTIASSPSNSVVIASSFFAGVFLLAVSGGLLGYAFFTRHCVSSGLFLGGLLACTVLWLGAIVCGLGLAKAMAELKREVGKQRHRG